MSLNEPTHEEWIVIRANDILMVIRDKIRYETSKYWLDFIIECAETIIKQANRMKENLK